MNGAKAICVALRWPPINGNLRFHTASADSIPYRIDGLIVWVRNVKSGSTTLGDHDEAV
jgi:hypothetical protein